MEDFEERQEDIQEKKNEELVKNIWVKMVEKEDKQR